MELRLVLWVAAGVTLGAVVSCGGKDSSTRGHGADAGRGGASLMAGRAGAGAEPGGGGVGVGGSGGTVELAGRSGTGSGDRAGGAAGEAGASAGGSSGRGGGSEAGAGRGGVSASGTDSGGAGGEAGAGAPKALNLLLMVDDSWSMLECGTATDGSFTSADPRCMDGPTRWALLTQALVAFVQDPGAEGLGVALRFFPSDVPANGCDGYPATSSGFGFGGAGAGGAGAGGAGAGGAGASSTSNCDVDACAVPLVDLGRLTVQSAPEDTQEQALVSAIQASGPPDVATLSPNPQTPTSAALGGAAKWARAYQLAHVDEATAIVLVTDGEPEGCDTNIGNIAAIAADAYATNGVRTFVIGLSGSNETALNQLAAAGATKQAVFVADGATVTQDLLASLNAIRHGAMP